MRVLLAQVLEGVEVAGGREARFGARDVEADDADVAVADGELRDLPRPRGVPHRRQQAADAHPPPVRRRDRRADAEALQHGLDDVLQREALLDVQLGCEAHLGVDDPVGGEVLRALGRHADQRVGGLEHGDGVAERLQVAHQRPGVRRAEEPRSQLHGVIGRQRCVTDLVGQLDDGPGPQPAVEVIMKEDLRGGADALDTQGDRHVTTLEHRPADR